MWLFLILFLGWLAWKVLNLSLEYILPLVLLLLIIAYAIKFWWLIAIAAGGWYFYRHRKLS
jgi:hypothetical protein